MQVTCKLCTKTLASIKTNPAKAMLELTNEIGQHLQVCHASDPAIVEKMIEVGRVVAAISTLATIQNFCDVPDSASNTQLNTILDEMTNRVMDYVEQNIAESEESMGTNGDSEDNKETKPNIAQVNCAVPRLTRNKLTAAVQLPPDNPAA